MPHSTTVLAALLLPWVLGTVPVALATARVQAPMTCTRGPAKQRLDVSVTMPASVSPGATFTVRIDGTNSGTISHAGLNHVRDATTEYTIPTGTAYVEGSARVVPDTGTPNVRVGARASQARNTVRLTLPARVPSGSSYVPPSLEFEVRVTAPPGDTMVLGFSRFRIVANAVVVGDLESVCTPTPRPFPLASTRVAP